MANALLNAIQLIILLMLLIKQIKPLKNAFHVLALA